MSELKIEDLAGMAREFKESAFGKYLIEYLEAQTDTLISAGMNATTSDNQLKGLNQAAGFRLVKEHLDQLAFYAEHPETLNK